MRDENDYKRYRLSRDSNGKIKGAKRVDPKDDLADTWSKQGNFLDKEPSLKEEFGINRGKEKLKLAAQKHKPKNVKVRKNPYGGSILNINLALPKLKSPKLLKKGGQVAKKKPILASVLGLAVVAGAIGVFMLSSSNQNDNQGTEVAGVAQEGIELNVVPEKPLLSPAGAGVESLGGFAKITPPGEPPAYAYTDKIGSVPIKVTQQELPDSIGQDPIMLRELASSFSATEQILVDDSPAYVGLSVNGPQSVIYSKGDILVLIVSDAEIPNSDWVKYLSDLKY